MARAGTSMARVAGLPSFLGRDPFRDFFDLQRGITRMFEDNVGPRGEGAALGTWAPAADIYEDDAAFLIKLDLPEVGREDVKVTLEKNVLSISGQRRLENEEKRENYHRVERTYGQFLRSFTLPPNANIEAVTADFKDGVLRISIPKKEEARPKQIEVNIG